MSESSLRLEGALAWLDRAAEDIRAARHSRDGGFCRNALFLCQQCAEKAIKGLLVPLTRNSSRFFRKHWDLASTQLLCGMRDLLTSQTQLRLIPHSQLPSPS